MAPLWLTSHCREGAGHVFWRLLSAEHVVDELRALESREVRVVPVVPLDVRRALLSLALPGTPQELILVHVEQHHPESCISKARSAIDLHVAVEQDDLARRYGRVQHQRLEHFLLVLNRARPHAAIQAGDLIVHVNRVQHPLGAEDSGDRCLARARCTDNETFTLCSVPAST
jgi:hypothetical protein